MSQNQPRRRRLENNVEAMQDLILATGDLRAMLRSPVVEAMRGLQEEQRQWAVAIQRQLIEAITPALPTQNLLQEFARGVQQQLSVMDEVMRGWPSFTLPTITLPSNLVTPFSAQKELLQAMTPFAGIAEKVRALAGEALRAHIRSLNIIVQRNLTESLAAFRGIDRDRLILSIALRRMREGNISEEELDYLLLRVLYLQPAPYEAPGDWWPALFEALVTTNWQETEHPRAYVREAVWRIHQRNYQMKPLEEEMLLIGLDDKINGAEELTVKDVIVDPRWKQEAHEVDDLVLLEQTFHPEEVEYIRLRVTGYSGPQIATLPGWNRQKMERVRKRIQRKAKTLNKEDWL